WWWALALVPVAVLGAWAWRRGRAPQLAADARSPGGASGERRHLLPGASGRKDVLDPLTGLATRLWLEDQLAAAVMRAEAGKRRLALLYINLDGFRPFNDSFGHGFGDALLREVGLRLQNMGRATDTVARMGGDEFLMLLDGDPDSAAAALVADRIRLSLQEPYRVGRREVRLSCSIGIVLYPDHGPRGKLIAHADAAMLAAKHAGGNM